MRRGVQGKARVVMNRVVMNIVRERDARHGG
jgi:hypothetical protein